MKFQMNQWSSTTYSLKASDEVWLLGSKLTVKGENQSESKVRLLHSLFLNIIWFTYRKNFPPLLGSERTSDTGWGCMIRVGNF